MPGQLWEWGNDISLHATLHQALLLYQLRLPLLNCAQNWQIESEQGHGQAPGFNYQEWGGRKGGGWAREEQGGGGLIGSADPVQAWRVGWHQASAVNCAAPSEHWGHEQWGLARGQTQVVREQSAAYVPSHPRRGGGGGRDRYRWFLKQGDDIYHALRAQCGRGEWENGGVGFCSGHSPEVGHLLWFFEAAPASTRLRSLSEMSYLTCLNGGVEVYKVACVICTLPCMSWRWVCSLNLCRVFRVSGRRYILYIICYRINYRRIFSC